MSEVPQQGPSAHGNDFCRNVKQSRGGLVFKAHSLAYHSTLDSRVIKREARYFLAAAFLAANLLAQNA